MLTPAMKEICVKAVPLFAAAKITADDLKSTVIGGGLTNSLYRISATVACRRSDDPSAHPRELSVVLRVFGADTDKLVSRDDELFWQSQFLRTFHKFDGGLIYEFLDCHRPLSLSELVSFQAPIARAYARFHIRAQMAVALHPTRHHSATQPNHLHRILREWTDLAFGESPPSEERRGKRAAALAVLGGESGVASEVKWYDEMLRKLSPLLPEAPCHNDLNAMNIMVRCPTTDDGDGDAGRQPSEASAVRFIDFEYMRRNYLYFDFGNHFCEYAGFEPDWRLYPSEETQKAFLTTYFAEVRAASARVDGAAAVAADDSSTDALSQLASDAHIHSVFVLTNFLALASSLTWGIWALVQAAVSTLETGDFDYLVYGRRRLERYAAKKDEAVRLLQQTPGIAELLQGK